MCFRTFFLKKKKKKEKQIPNVHWLRNQQKKLFFFFLTIVYKGASFFKHEYDLSPSTLRDWASTRHLKHIRTPGGKRLYDLDGVLALLGRNEPSKKSYVYARVSSAKQRGDLERQIQDLKEAYPGHILVKDVASGVNFKRPGLQTILEQSLKGVVEEVVVMHRDRLARIGYDLLEFIFAKAGTKIVVYGQDESTDEHDLADDLLAVTTLFVASHHGRRAAANRKRRREEERRCRESEEEEGGEEKRGASGETPEN